MVDVRTIDQLPPTRERLERHTGGDLSRTLGVIGCNPSTAGPNIEDKNDPTLVRLLAIARANGYGRLLVGNLDTYRASKPAIFFNWVRGMKLLHPAAFRAHREHALTHILNIANESTTLVAAWGKWPDEDIGWPLHVRATLSAEGFPLHAFGFNLDGTPRHPMARGAFRMPDTVEPVLWPYPGEPR